MRACRRAWHVYFVAVLGADKCQYMMWSNVDFICVALLHGNPSGRVYVGLMRLATSLAGELSPFCYVLERTCCTVSCHPSMRMFHSALCTLLVL